MNINMIRKIMLIFFVLFSSLTLVSANNSTNTINETQNGLFEISIENELNQNIIILLLIVGFIFIIFTSKIWIGGIMLSIIGLILLFNDFSLLISILLLLGGVIAIFS